MHDDDYDDSNLDTFDTPRRRGRLVGRIARARDLHREQQRLAGQHPDAYGQLDDLDRGPTDFITLKGLALVGVVVAVLAFALFARFGFSTDRLTQQFRELGGEQLALAQIRSAKTPARLTVRGTDGNNTTARMAGIALPATACQRRVAASVLQRTLPRLRVVAVSFDARERMFVHTKDGKRLLTATFVRRGGAKIDTDKLGTRRTQMLIDAQDQARRAHRGIWGACR